MADPHDDRDAPLPLADLARYREATYRLSSIALLYLEDEQRKALASDARDLLGAAARLSEFASFPQWQELLRVLISFGDEDGVRLRKQHVSLFAVGRPDVPCPPFESHYRGDGVTPTGEILAQLEGEYARAGLELAGNVGEPPDHVALELSFVATLCGREAEAWDHVEDRGQASEATSTLQRWQRDFVTRHLSAWLPAFAADLEEAAPGSVYAGVSALVSTFIRYDRDLLTALLEANAAAHTVEGPAVATTSDSDSSTPSAPVATVRDGGAA